MQNERLHRNVSADPKVRTEACSSNVVSGCERVAVSCTFEKRYKKPKERLGGRKEER